MAQVGLFQKVYLEIPLHGVKLGHAVGNRGAGSEHHALAACDFVDVPAFQQHIAGLLCIAGGEARHVAHFGVEEQVFIRKFCFHRKMSVSLQLTTVLTVTTLRIMTLLRF